ncbi:MAG TPA: pseudouridine synthase [Verrucomicrobiae bacterium]|nr:pseudouridine synthase [Verrucomicrobiae bacterium]
MSAAIKLSSPATKEFWEIPVLFEDGHLLALDKPAGLMVSPDPDNLERPSLMKLLHEGIAAGKPWAKERGVTYLNNPHRLDTGASGVILLAKDKTVFMALADQFSAEKPVRKHVALIWGNPLDDAFEVDQKLSPHPLKPGEMCVDARLGKKAHTKFEVIERFTDWCLLNCRPLTDRQHQIRVHLKYVSCAVVGDEVYGGKNLWLSRLKKDYRLKPGRDERPLLGRAALHLEELSLSHPLTHEPVVIKSELPKDFKVALKYLRQYAVAR